MLHHPLTNFKMQNIIKMNLDLMVFIQETDYVKIRGGAYIKNLDKYESIGTDSIA